MDIEYAGFGRIIVDGTRFDHDVVIEAGAVRARDKTPSRAVTSGSGHTPLSAAEDIPWSGPQLVIGSGYSGRLPIRSDVHERAAELGVELVVLPTAEACSLLRRRHASEITAILHVTC
ncbi:MAG: hypothetical protein OEM97_05105 [Acidimicrobiia bacterium]|nr:hypothetical protein [Acidimicrobiia bacterium]